MNRDLCTALAAFGHDVVCLTLDPTPREVAEAERFRVRLVGCPDEPGIDRLQRLLLIGPKLVPGFAPDVIIGHDHITGAAAAHAARRIFECRYVHFIHTLPEEIEPYKTARRDDSHDGRNGAQTGASGSGPIGLSLRGANKAALQVRHCGMADLVVAVGPRIHVEIETRVGPNCAAPIVQLRPGFDRQLLANTPNLDRPRLPHCLFLGRVEDVELKGARLACDMIRRVNSDWKWSTREKPMLVMRGFDPEHFAQEIELIGESQSLVEHLVPRPYTSSASEVAADIRSASLLVMPSKREGFGLVAMEAMAAGIPVLVSARSGFAELLLEPDVTALIGQPSAEACIAEVDGPDDSTIARTWAERVRDVLCDRRAAFKRAEDIRNGLKNLLTWERAAVTLSTTMTKLL